MACLRGEVLALQSSNPGRPDDFFDFYVDVDDEADWDPSHLNTSDWPLEHIFLETNFKDIQETCCRVGVTCTSSMTDVVDFAVDIVSASITSDVF